MEYHYNPDKHPDPTQWVALDEDEKLRLVEEWHRKRRIRLPNATLHAVIHVVVENQVALGDEIPARETLLRLIGEGLDRHDALHAVGSVLAAHLFDMLKTGWQGGDRNAVYYDQLRRLTAESWLKSGGG